MLHRTFLILLSKLSGFEHILGNLHRQTVKLPNFQHSLFGTKRYRVSYCGQPKEKVQIPKDIRNILQMVVPVDIIWRFSFINSVLVYEQGANKILQDERINEASSQDEHL